MQTLTQRFLENILNNIPDPVFVKNEKHEWVMMNVAFCNLLGYSMEKLIGKSDYDFFSKEEADVFWEKDRLVFESEKENINEESFTGSDGETKIISTRKNIVKDQAGKKYLVGVIHDISEKKKLIRKLQDSNSMLENYAYMASHDLKSPLRTMMSFSQLLTRTASHKLNNEEAEYLNFIGNAATNMSDLVDKLLDFSRINKTNLKIEKISISKIVEEIKSEMAYDIAQVKCEIRTMNLPQNIKGDKKLIKLLFQNLISNAIKFSHLKRVPEIEITCDEQENRNEFHVVDNGIGIESQHYNTIFKIFKKLHSNAQYEGAGIGLALCSLIAEQHSGYISVKSVVGKGSNFKFMIPKINS